MIIKGPCKITFGGDTFIATDIEIKSDLSAKDQTMISDSLKRLLNAPTANDEQSFAE